MVQGYQIRRAIIILIAVVLLVFIIAQIAGFARRTFTDDVTADEEPTPIVLTEYDDTDSKVRMIFSGEIVAKEEFRSVRITVSSSERVFELIRGYDGEAITRKTYPNTLAAYQSFIRAIDFEGFASFQKNKLGDDERGVCPDGNRTVTELYDENQLEMRLWSASCNRRLGTLAGESRAIRELFQNQIPEYRELTKDVRF